MGSKCYFTGKTTRFGNKVTKRGKAKYLGGVGTKITGISRRKIKPNLQKVRALVNGRVQRITVSTKAIRMGLVVKPVVHKPFRLDPKLAAEASAKAKS
jgi:large subunit ribosomal protein L28